MLWSWPLMCGVQVEMALVGVEMCLVETRSVPLTTPGSYLIHVYNYIHTLYITYVSKKKHIYIYIFYIFLYIYIDLIYMCVCEFFPKKKDLDVSVDQ